MLSPLALVPMIMILAGTTTRDEEAAEVKTFTVTPIGRIQVDGDKSLIVLDKKYEPGLLGLEKFSHIWVIWWFHKNDTTRQRSVLQVHPRGDQRNPLRGVFATRSPVRPNLIALTRCKIVAIEGTQIQVEKIDAVDGTPVLDIKPFAPALDLD